MSDFIGIDVQGLDKVQRLLKNLPEEAQDAASDAMSNYYVDIFRIYPPQSYVSIKRAGGWRSEKQRRFVMMAIRKGLISVPYKRTQRLRKGWKVLDRGKDSIIVNETPYAGFVQNQGTQSRMMQMRQWDVIQDLVKDRMPKALEKAMAAIRKVIARLGG